jgi:hypothetical protein
MTHLLTLSADHTTSFHQQMTSATTENTSNMLTQEGQNLNPLGDVRYWYVLSLEHPDLTMYITT